MKVLISDKVDPGCVEILRQGGIEAEVDTGLSPAQLLEAIPRYEGLIVRSSTKVTEEVIKAATQLQVVGRAGTGFDNIDVDAATRHGVVVMNTPGGNSVSTAELTFAMLMALARNIPQGTASLKSGKWERSAYTGVELAGKTLGVMGLGKVGREVAARASAFNMRVLGYDPYISEEAIVSYGTRPSSLNEIYAQADFITVHLHLTEQTRHYISDEELTRCKDGVFVLNCARGGLVDEAALLRGLESGKVGGAALDVFEQEPPPAGGLLAHERVICTPHLGASTREAQASVALQVAEQVRDLLKDRVIRNAVNVPSVPPEVYRAIRPYLELAEKLGRLQAQLGEGQLQRVTVEYHGDVTAHPTSPLTAAVLKGVMDSFSGEPVNFVNAPLLAQERGVHVDELKSTEHEDYASLISVTYQTSAGRRLLAGAIFGKGEPRLVRLDDYIFDAPPQGHMLFYLNDDIPGIIGRIGTVMGGHGVNIAQMSCGRLQAGDKALTILNVDNPIPDEAIAEILPQEHVSWVKKVSL